MGGSEPGVRRNYRLEGVRQAFGYGDGIALNHEIDVDIFPTKEEIPHIAADGIDRRRGGSLACRLEYATTKRVELSEPRKCHRCLALYTPLP
jgi:hypothetical protein